MPQRATLFLKLDQRLHDFDITATRACAYRGIDEFPQDDNPIWAGCNRWR